MTRRSGRAPGIAVAAVVLPLLLAPGACAENGAEATGEGEAPIDRETFVATYVDLRLAALRNRDGEITPEERARVLGQHGVSEEDVIGFVEVHGDDSELMEEVWSEIESRLDSLRSPSDTASS